MPRPTSFNRVCCPKAMMACHVRRHSTVCSPRAVMSCHARPNLVRPCVQSKGSDIMPRQTSFSRLCFPKAMIAYHARHRSTV